MPKTPWSKVVLHRELRSQWIMAKTCDDYIDTCGVVLRFEAPLEFSYFNINRTLVGVIELNWETFPTTQTLHGNLFMDDA